MDSKELKESKELKVKVCTPEDNFYYNSIEEALIAFKNDESITHIYMHEIEGDKKIAHRFLPRKKQDLLKWDEIKKQKLETFECYNTATLNDILWIDMPFDEEFHNHKGKLRRKFEDDIAHIHAEAHQIKSVFTSSEFASRY